MKNDWFDRFIFVKENALDSDFCKSVIQKFEDDDRKYPGVTGSGLSDAKKSTDLHISVCNGWENEDKVFYNSLKQGISDYYDYINSFVPCKSLDILFSQLSDSGYQIQRTFPSEYYTMHSDFFVENGKPRVFTYIWYLNDVTSIGGETKFINGKRIKPKEGSLMFFPSTWTYLHSGISPKSATKYICTGWVFSTNTTDTR